MSIYRLSSVTGDRVNGICNETDLIWRLVRLYVELGVIPDLDLLLNMTPADDVGAGDRPARGPRSVLG